MNAVRRAAFGVLLAGLAALACLLFGSGFASADTHIIVGGNTDCTSQGLENTLAAQGRLQGNPVPVTYGSCDGDFAPFAGSTTPGDAFNQGVAATRAAWDQHCADGSRCVIEGFSYGDAPVAVVGNDVGADQPGSNTHVITNGNAWGAPGMFGDTPGVVGGFIKIGAPIIGVPQDIAQVPGSENRNNVNDAWGNNAGQPPWAEITDLATINGDANSGLPPQHNVPDGAPTAEFTTPDGVHQEFYGTPLPGVIPPQDNPVLQADAALAP